MKLIKIKNFGSIAEAELARNFLKENGIESVVRRGDLAAAGEFTGAIGDADLLVSEENIKKAEEILKNGEY
ncbi:hypothetical protein A2Z53_02440 [Candidatus Giovannonibacteria bacterium RIFCSPHIGHO2_02_42_15]|uniref:DUF2007 domain-containing protein n=2 Tax=Candidatus Giovannoniibacteriota TaxID=1752738 RepID=A0A1F5VPT3_9BACT|nr:MAG: hypothetical protein UV11_C0006G0006 [Candidatus Giovannonibacteria bacterium GW2011_GWF2_42_19]OGF65348.1 MAG: hypothetical protein A2Z53_02440 [Candidatus Giovannonibacteria bacterium RIFCSPHIGHO2_02_42_15]